MSKGKDKKEQEEKKVVEERAQCEAEEQERLKKKAEKKVEHCKKECQKAEENTKRQAAHVAKEQLVGVVMPDVDKMHKEKGRAEVEVEEMPK